MTEGQWIGGKEEAKLGVGIEVVKASGRDVAQHREKRLLVIAPFTVEGACIALRSAEGVRSVFEIWLETCLVPVLQAGEWVILDNATFHHGGRIAELIAAKGAKVVDLPPDSPDLNRIEKCWAWLKSQIRKQRRNATSLREAIEAVLKQAVS